MRMGGVGSLPFWIDKSGVCFNESGAFVLLYVMIDVWWDFFYILVV